MTKARTLVDVAPAVPLPASGRQAYTYRLPPKAAATPHLFGAVTIPFGRLTVPGVIVKIHRGASPRGVKTVQALSPVALTQKQVKFARWIARIASGGMGYTLRLFQPPGRTVPASARAGVGRAEPPASTARLMEAVIERDAASRHSAIARQVSRKARRGSQALVVVPERWMIAPLSRALAASLNTEIAEVHAGKGASYLTGVWHGVKDGRISVVVGTQKALFLPLRNLRLVVVEEEYYTTHKLWDQYPRLHNVYAAEQLAAIHQADLLYTTSFPSLRLQAAIERGDTFARKPNPIKPRPSVVPFAVDDRLKGYPLPHELLIKLKRWQKQREKILLLYNRRDQAFIKNVLTHQGLAGQRGEPVVTTTAIFAAMPEETFDRIVWLFPERDVGYPDFRSNEHALYTLARLQQLYAGSRRQVYLVTRRENMIRPALEGDAITARLLQERKTWTYPPFTDIVRLTVSGRTRQLAWRRGSELRRQLDERAAGVRVRGPFHSLEKEPTSKKVVHLLLIGPQGELPSLYEGLSVDSADLAPARIL